MMTQLVQLTGKKFSKMSNKSKDRIILILVCGLVALLTLITVGDFIVAIRNDRTVDDNIIDLLQMSITGIIGIVSGYIVGNKKKDDES
jgi:hypothetical protein